MGNAHSTAGVPHDFEAISVRRFCIDYRCLRLALANPIDRLGRRRSGIKRIHGRWRQATEGHDGATTGGGPRVEGDVPGLDQPTRSRSAGLRHHGDEASDQWAGATKVHLVRTSLKRDDAHDLAYRRALVSQRSRRWNTRITVPPVRTWVTLQARLIKRSRITTTTSTITETSSAGRMSGITGPTMSKASAPR